VRRSSHAPDCPVWGGSGQPCDDGAVSRLEPMLASTGSIAPASDWAFEPKLDGWRVLVHVNANLEVRTRGGHNVAVAVPELAPLLDALDGGSVVAGATHTPSTSTWLTAYSRQGRLLGTSHTAPWPSRSPR
jgi:hypothetical protein